MKLFKDQDPACTLLVEILNLKFHASSTKQQTTVHNQNSSREHKSLLETNGLGSSLFKSSPSNAQQIQSRGSQTVEVLAIGGIYGRGGERTFLAQIEGKGVEKGEWKGRGDRGEGGVEGKGRGDRGEVGWRRRGDRGGRGDR